MAARHHRKSAGGVVRESADGVKASTKKPDADWSKDADVEKDSGPMKRGGAVKKHDGHYACGGAAKKRMDRPGRKRGGACGSDMSPLSSASKTTKASGTMSSEEGD